MTDHQTLHARLRDLHRFHAEQLDEMTPLSPEQAAAEVLVEDFGALLSGPDREAIQRDALLTIFEMVGTGPGGARVRIEIIRALREAYGEDHPGPREVMP